MKRILTTVGGFQTGDDIADAVIVYALALARAHQTDTVDIPYRTERGAVERLELRIGWLVDIGVVQDRATREDIDGTETFEPETVQQLREDALAVGGHGYVPQDGARSWPKWEYEL
ncbi:hypothetical protein [Microbacterium aurantiacum]|uniref:hypothetical protein n=1 Tax=Microbacterium aurantiacum TaxID=162393 RepID=UPI000C7FACAB|nr:hypothetical protein [Microbacterium aurantiacum]